LQLLISLRKRSRLIIWQQQLRKLQIVQRSVSCWLLCQQATKGR
jgi:hypothetical protein